MVFGWDRDEDEALWETIRSLYGPMVELSLTFPSLRKDRLHRTLGVLMFYLVAFPVHIFLLTMNLMNCVWDDFNLASLEFHYWLLLVFSILAVGAMFYKRSHFKSVHRSMMTDLAAYGTGRIYSEEEPIQFENEKRKQTLQFIFLPGLILSLAGVALLVPYFKKMDGTVKYNTYGANMKLPIPACYPFRTHEGLLHVVVVVGQLMAASGIAAIIASLDLMFFRGVQAILFEYRVLQYAVRTIFERASILCEQLYQDSWKPNIETRDSHYQRCIGLCLKDCVVHHYKISKLTLEFEMMMSWITAMAYVFGTGVIGLSLVNIKDAMESKNYENVIIFTMFGMAEVLSIFVISYFGERITTAGMELRDAVYFIDWFNLNLSNRKMVLNFQVGINEPRVVKGGGVTAQSLDTFSTIMNTAYSFFNLMNVSMD